MLKKHKIGNHDPDKTAKCFMDKYNLDARWELCLCAQDGTNGWN